MVDALSASAPRRLVDLADLPPAIAAAANSRRAGTTLRERERTAILKAVVITSYSIHYTKLYDSWRTPLTTADSEVAKPPPAAPSTSTTGKS